MAETYFVDCDCGSKVRVELFDAGTQKLCPNCKSTIKIPSSNKLKELSGDKYPLLSPIEKLRVTAESGEPPFDGQCHGCSATRAAWSTLCVLQVMVERHVTDEGGIRPSVTGGIKLVASASEETWQRIEFPLLLCEQCQTQFEADRRLAKILGAVKFFALLGLLVTFLYFAYNNSEMIAAFSLLSIDGRH